MSSIPERPGRERDDQTECPATSQSPATEHNPQHHTAEGASGQSSGLPTAQNEIISQLEVDVNRSDNDSSLGSEITS